MRFGNYTLTHRVGAGGMGTVFRAVDAFNKPVALKIIGSQAVINATVHAGGVVPQLPAMDLGRRMMFVREARLAMGLNHPNIVRVFDYGQHQGLLFIVMEFLAGRSLEKVIPLRAAVPMVTRISLIRQLCEALDYAHGQNVIHRDVKPPNCFVLQNNELKVLDFGIASSPEFGRGEVPMVGTPPFMAPEVCSSPPRYTKSVDIWAAGVTLYQFLTGLLPFTGNSMGQLMRNITVEPFPPLDESIPHAKELGRILERALAKDPVMRYASAADFAWDLSSLERALEEPGGPLHSGSISSGKSHWWATSVARETDLTSPLPNSSSETVSMISGEIRARRGGHKFRFVEMSYRIGAAVVVASVFACSSVLLLRNYSGPLESEWWASLAYIFGFLVPPLAAAIVVLAGLSFWEEAAAIPHCRTCQAILAHRSGITAFAYSKTSWRHASSDCLAALRENLWEDAAKLLSIHGELMAPKLEEKTAYPPLRLHLDYYECGACGDEMAILTTEDRIRSNNVSASWKTREEYEAACKQKHRTIAVASPPWSTRLKVACDALKRAAWRAVGPVHLVLLGSLLIAACLTGIYYYPQFGVLVGLPGYRALITIQTDPPGGKVTVDDQRIQTPYTVGWAYGSAHRIDFDRHVHINGRPYKFERFSRLAFPAPSSSRQQTSISPDVGILIDTPRDRWGRLISNRDQITYSIQYQPSTDDDRNAMTQWEFAESLKTKGGLNNGTDIKPHLGQAANSFKMSPGPHTIVVTSDPPGLDVIVDGVRITTPKSYSWELGSGHTLIVPGGNQALNRGTAASAEIYEEGRWDFGIKEDTNRIRINWSAIPFPSTYTAKFRRSTQHDVALPVRSSSADTP